MSRETLEAAIERFRLMLRIVSSAILPRAVEILENLAAYGQCSAGPRLTIAIQSHDAKFASPKHYQLSSLRERSQQ